MGHWYKKYDCINVIMRVVTFEATPPLVMLADAVGVVEVEDALVVVLVGPNSRTETKIIVIDQIAPNTVYIDIYCSPLQITLIALLQFFGCTVPSLSNLKQFLSDFASMASFALQTIA